MRIIKFSEILGKWEIFYNRIDLKDKVIDIESEMSLLKILANG